MEQGYTDIASWDNGLSPEDPAYEQEVLLQGSAIDDLLLRSRYMARPDAEKEKTEKLTKEGAEQWISWRLEKERAKEVIAKFRGE